MKVLTTIFAALLTSVMAFSAQEGNQRRELIPSTSNEISLAAPYISHGWVTTTMSQSDILKFFEKILRELGCNGVRIDKNLCTVGALRGDVCVELRCLGNSYDTVVIMTSSMKASDATNLWDQIYNKF